MTVIEKGAEVDLTKTQKTVEKVEQEDDLTDEELEQIAAERKRLEDEKAIEKKNATKTYIQQLRDEKAAEKTRGDTLELELSNMKKQNEHDVACATFGEEIINSEEVKGYKERHPDLSYEDCVKLAGYDLKQTAKQSFIGRVNKKVEAKSSYTMTDLEKMSPVERANALAKARRGEAKIT